MFVYNFEKKNVLKTNLPNPTMQEPCVLGCPYIIILFDPKDLLNYLYRYVFSVGSMRSVCLESSEGDFNYFVLMCLVWKILKSISWFFFWVSDAGLLRFKFLIFPRICFGKWWISLVFIYLGNWVIIVLGTYSLTEFCRVNL